MSKRNLTILIIVLITITAVLFGFSYFSKTSTTNTTEQAQDTNFVSQFFPLIKKIIAPASEVTPPADISGFTPVTTQEQPKTKLNKISSIPIAGYGIFMKERFKDILSSPQNTEIETTTEVTPPPTELVPAVKYVDKTIGNIYQTFASNIYERKFSEIVIPNVHEAYFTNNGESVVMRYLKEDNKTIETFIGTLPKETPGSDSTENNTIDAVFLPENVSDLSISPDGSKIFYLFNSSNSVVGIISDTSGVKKSQVFDSPFTEWLSWWPNNKIITLTTKPSSNVPGHMYELDLNKKEFNKVLENINGLTTLASPSGEMVLYSDNNLSLRVYDTKTRESISVGLKTLPEKCVWGKTSEYVYCAVPKYVEQGNYPDSWYMGEISFSDEIWRMNIEIGAGTLLSDTTSVNGVEDIDGIRLSLDENENYLFFINKKDSYLWKLDLN
ncbi:hypothetical protein KKA39_00675 [Patescibacteria group bacterium]|nr:hypothetical protein [Patescibacteria group bacterium]MBU1727814.1 hypothetical protein [Patescibacteria group bacterium]